MGLKLCTKALLLVLFLATIFAEYRPQEKERFSPDVNGNAEKPKGDVSEILTQQSNGNIKDNHETQQNPMVVVSEISENDEKVETADANDSGAAEKHQTTEKVAQSKLYVPWDHETVSCKRWKTQVLDCGDQNQGRNGQKGQKGEKGDSGRELKGESGVTGDDGVRGERGQLGHDGRRGGDGRQGDEGPRGEEGEAGPGCVEEELEEMVRRNEMMEEDFEEAVKDQERMEGEYEALKASHDENQELMYKLMGGLKF